MEPAALARRRAVVPQSSALNFPFTVLEVILQGRAPHFDGRKNGVDEAAALAAHGSRRSHALGGPRYTTLSGGDASACTSRALSRKSAWKARAVARSTNPPPASTSGTSTTSCASSEIRRLGRLAFVVVLHDLNLCARYADKVFLLHYGRVLGSATRAP